MAETTDCASGFDRSFMPGLRDGGTVELSFQHDPDDPGQLALESAYLADGEAAIMPCVITLPDIATSASLSRIYTFDGFVVKPPQGALALTEDGIAEQTAAIKVVGAVTIGAESAGFDLASLPGLTLWLDALNPGAEYGDGDGVPLWADQSGNENNGEQGDGDLLPVFKENVFGTLPGVGFDVAANPATFAVRSRLAHVTNIGFHDGDPIGDWSEYYVVKLERGTINVLGTIDGWYVYFPWGNVVLTGGDFVETDFALEFDTSYLFSYRFDSAVHTIKFRLGGATQDIVDPDFFVVSDASALTLTGGDQFGDSSGLYIAERISVNRKTTDLEDLAIRTYLAAKWEVST